MSINTILDTIILTHYKLKNIKSIEECIAYTVISILEIIHVVFFYLKDHSDGESCL